MIDTDFRPLTTQERQLLEKLLQPPCPNAEALRTQLSKATAKTIDVNGSIQFNVTSGTRLSVKDRPVVEATYPDGSAGKTDRVRVNIILHIKGGLLWMLEIYKDDSSSVLTPPDANTLDVFVR